MSDFIELLNSEIQEISSKKFNSKVASANFSDFQRELATCLFSDFVIEIDDDDCMDDHACDSHPQDNTAKQGNSADSDDEERRQILQFIKHHLDEFVSKYDCSYMENLPCRELASGRGPDKPALESSIAKMLPPVTSAASLLQSNLSAWSDVIEGAVSSSWDITPASKATG